MFIFILAFAMIPAVFADGDMGAGSRTCGGAGEPVCPAAQEVGEGNQPVSFLDYLRFYLGIS